MTVYIQWNATQLKNKEILVFVRRWIELEGIMLTVTSHKQKCKAD